MASKDLRMRSLDEMMVGIKPIKYNSMEPIFDEKVLLYFILSCYLIELLVSIQAILCIFTDSLE